MVIGVILEKLKDEGYRFTYSGEKHAEIYAVDLFSDSFYNAGNNVLYLYDANLMQIPQDKSGSFLGLQGCENLQKISIRIQDWIIMDAKRRDALAKLQQDVLMGSDMRDFAGHLSQIMQNPVLILTPALEIVSKYTESNFTEEEIAHILDQADDWRNSRSKWTSDTLPYCQFCAVCYNEEDYYICVVEKALEFDTIIDREYSQKICAVFDSGVGKSARNDPKYGIILGLLQRRFPEPEKEIERLKKLGWKEQEKYYILAIERDPELPAGSQQKELKKIIGSEVYILGKYYVAIPYSEKYTEYTEQNFPELREYLEKKNLYGVLSMGFVNFSDCGMRFEQCKTCFTLIPQERGQNLRYHGYYQISHIISILNRDHKIDLRNFCNPIILQLYEIDREQNANYLNTLYTYLCSGQSVKYSAEALGIHVNTMYMRVNRLKDEFHIDFSDEHMLYNLHNSIVLLELYYGNCLEKYYPFRK